MYEAAMKEVRKWYVSSDEVALATAERERLRKRYGCAIRAISSVTDSSTLAKETIAMRRRLLCELVSLHRSARRPLFGIHFFTHSSPDSLEERKVGEDSEFSTSYSVAYLCVFVLYS